MVFVNRRIVNIIKSTFYNVYILIVFEHENYVLHDADPLLFISKRFCTF